MSTDPVNARVAAAREAAEKLVSATERRTRWQIRLMAAAATVVSVLLIVLGTVTIHDENRLDRQLLNAAHDRTQLLVQVQECLYNHEDRILAQATRRPVPPLRAGCPPDAQR